MDFETTISRQFLRGLLKNKAAQAHILEQVARSEEEGEAELFSEMLEVVSDARFVRMIERHQADEIMHAKLFRECLARVGVGTPDVPEELSMLYMLGRDLGTLNRRINVEADVYPAYVVLQVIEERAVQQFPLYAEVFDEIDPFIADVFRRVARDEERHLRYCRAICRHYAASDDANEAELERVRTVEAKCYREATEKSVAYFKENRLMEGAFRRFVWSNLSRVFQSVQPLPYTPFRTDPRIGPSPLAEAMSTS